MDGVGGAYQSLHGNGEPAADAASFGDICTGAIRMANVGRAHFEGS